MSNKKRAVEIFAEGMKEQVEIGRGKFHISTKSELTERGHEIVVNLSPLMDSLGDVLLPPLAEALEHLERRIDELEKRIS